MNKRKLIITLAGVVILGGSVVLAMNLRKEDEAKKEVELATAVKAQKFSPGEVQRSIAVTGRLVPENSIQLFAEVGGRANFGTRPFKEGNRFSKGEVILSIDSEEIRSGLTASRSNFQSQLASVLPDLKIDFPDAAPKWEDYLYSIDINDRLPELPEVEDKKLKLFLSGRNVFSTYHNIRERETRLDKHLLRAPFSGSVTEANIDEGELVRIGQPLGELISTGRYEVMMGVSYDDIKFVQPGKKFELTDVNTGSTFEAEIIRVNDKVDMQTQQVQVYAQVIDTEARSGVYVRGKIPAETFYKAIRVPAQALVQEKYVFVVADSVARLQEITIPYMSAESAIIQGIESEQNIIIDEHNMSLDGSKVTIVNPAEE